MPIRLNRRSFLKKGAPFLHAARHALSWGGLSLAGAAALDREWRYYGGNPGYNRYSSLNQINISNVAKLRVAWTYNTGDKMDRPRTTMECTPIVVGRVMYVTTPLLKVRALDAASGRLRWNFDPFNEIGEFENSGAESIRNDIGGCLRNRGGGRRRGNAARSKISHRMRDLFNDVDRARAYSDDDWSGARELEIGEIQAGVFQRHHCGRIGELCVPGHPARLQVRLDIVEWLEVFYFSRNPASEVGSIEQGDGTDAAATG